MKIRKRFEVVEREDIVNKSQECLYSSKGVPGLNYLTQTRKLSLDTIKDFKLGYIPDIDHQLQNRVIFPIYDTNNNLIAIHSRAINNQEGLLPTYWHESYEKSFYLYGLVNARDDIIKNKFCLITEGQIDVLQLHSNGLKNTVGLFSHNLSEIQFSLVKRYCDKIIILFDTDANQSGQIGAQKTLLKFGKYKGEKIVNFKDRISHIDFAENIDPDQYVIKYGIDKLKKIIDEKLEIL